MIIGRSNFRTSCLLIALLCAGPASAAVYRCGGEGEPPRFTQFPCPDGSAVPLDALQIVEVPPISDLERELLRDIEQAGERARERRAAVRRAAAREARQARSDHLQRCREARQQLAALDRQRRKGYTLAEARRLDRQEAALEQQRRDYC